MTLLNKTTLIALVATAAIAAPTAHAATSQEDVQTCRKAMDDRGGIDLTNYRLRFEHAKGNNQGRTLTIKAIPHKYGQSFRFKCTLNKNVVTALKSAPSVKFARR